MKRREKCVSERKNMMQEANEEDDTLIGVKKKR